MKRNLNIEVKTRDGKPFSDGKKSLMVADCCINALDMFNGQAPAGITKRAISALADRITVAKKPAKDVELSPGDAELIVAALEGQYVPIVVDQIAKYIEAK